MRRRRVCNICKRRFTTYEKVGAPGLKVTKRDGSIEAFDGDKLFGALRRVAAHRSAVSDEDLRRIARDIEATLVDSGRKSIAWSDIVTLALSRLANANPVSPHRPGANFTAEAGVIRCAPRPPDQPSPQLGLPLTEPDD